MKERSILFSDPMVRAILDGRKTQTRQVMQPQPRILAGELLCWKGDALTAKMVAERCPCGQPGDVLWVKEDYCQFPEDALDGNGAQIYYRASQHNDQMAEVERVMVSNGVRWIPGIYMPRWASRILLEIVSVRVERLNDISESDARAEGCNWSDGAPDDYGLSTQFVVDAKNEFRHLWDSIKGPDNWNSNPWVRVVEFKRVLP